MLKIDLNTLYMSEFQEKDKLDSLAINNYLKKINDCLWQVQLLSLDYNCWMDYKCMFHPNNLVRIGNEEEINKHKANFQPLLPKESLETIKEEIGMYLMHVLRFYIIINYLQGKAYSLILEKINKSNPKPLGEYERVRLNLAPHNYSNLSFAIEIIKLCEMLGFPLKERLINTFHIGG